MDSNRGQLRFAKCTVFNSPTAAVEFIFQIHHTSDMLRLNSYQLTRSLVLKDENLQATLCELSKSIF